MLSVLHQIASEAVGNTADMDEDQASIPGSPVVESGATPGTSELSSYDKQLASLRTYFTTLPYKCESVEEMESYLAQIVHKLYAVTSARLWHLLAEWNEQLSAWLRLRYPIKTETRAALLAYYYEVSLIPGLPFYVVNDSIHMFDVLAIYRSGQSQYHYLDAKDLQLDWKSLWRVLRKEIWPMSGLSDQSVKVNLFLYLAECSRLYYPPSEIPSMLDTLLPLLTKDSVLSIIPVLTSFLPLRCVDQYLPALFGIFTGFNSHTIDARMIELAGILAEEHVAGLAGAAGEQGMRWRDIGIWTEDQWTYLISKCLGTLNLPMGSAKDMINTAMTADVIGEKTPTQIKKGINVGNSFSKLIVYSMAVDGPFRTNSLDNNEGNISSAITSNGFLAGSKALDCLSKMITSAETFFHPSNFGIWTLHLANFLHRLSAEFCKRWKEEQEPKCKTPITQRLTPDIRREFVLTLRTPALLSLFAKDPVSMTMAQAALRLMALLEPSLIMPQLLERAYSGLEVVNETHRTTAVLSVLSSVALPLVSSRIWPSGQKHLVPLLDLCLPGIDLNDPTKTICATMFICAAIQHVKIGDLSIHAAYRAPFLDEGTAMDLDSSDSMLPLGREEDGTSNGLPAYSKEEERALTRDSTAGFSDWLVSLFHRVFALYENLPEEGGRRNITGGKQEESVLKSIKNTLDVICLHLSDELFELILKVVYDYATTNAKSNAVRAFGQLVACLARVKPKETLDRFLPVCSKNIFEELKHGASSERTNASHAAALSDTTLHWNMAILRGCLGYGGPALVEHKEAILNLIEVLVEKTKSERGYSSAGRLITRVLHTLSGVYPLNCRFVNLDEWDSGNFNQNHDLHWGRMYHQGDIKTEWHVPNEEEISFILEILERIGSSLSMRLFSLLENTSWDNAARNDFCRYLYALRAIWAGLPTFVQFQETKPKDRQDSGYPDDFPTELIPMSMPVEAGFTLTDPRDPRFQAVMNHRLTFGRLVHTAAVALQGNVDSEDQVDAIVSVAKSIEVYLLDYAATQSNYFLLSKNYRLARDANRSWPRQRENSRLVFLKRAQVYHTARLSLHSMKRHLSDFDTLLVDDLIDLSLSSYARLRRYGQSVLGNVCNHFRLAGSSVFGPVLKALTRGSDPDRMKGALYVLSKKEIVLKLRLLDQVHLEQIYAYVVAQPFSERSLLNDSIAALLECQHQEKPSVQKLVATAHHDLLKICAQEECLQTARSFDLNENVLGVLTGLRVAFLKEKTESSLLDLAREHSVARADKDNVQYEKMILSILEIAKRPSTHWRYLQMAIRSLISTLRRDTPVHPAIGQLFAEFSTKSHSTTRSLAQKGMVKLLALIKIRTFSNTLEEAWLQEWRNPLSFDVPIPDPGAFVEALQKPFSVGGYAAGASEVYIDKINSGFIAWSPTIKGYREATEDAPLSSIWEEQSRPVLSAIDMVFRDGTYFNVLLSLWSQEADSKKTDLDLRSTNVAYAKTIAKTFEQAYLGNMIACLTPLLYDMDRFKQRAGAEFLAGLIRGSKHWPPSARNYLQDWYMGQIGEIFAHIRPDTISFWESFFETVLVNTDPRRNQALVSWLLSLQFDFNTDSAFACTKTLVFFSSLIETMGIRMSSISKRYVNLLLDHADTSYAEIRTHLVSVMTMLTTSEWNPWYPSVGAFISACQNDPDPLGLHIAPYLERVKDFAGKLSIWKTERLAPPRVAQSQYDKISLTLLSWIWTEGHGADAPSIFPYVLPLLPEILRMAELSDNPELQTYSSAILTVMSAVTPPREYIAKIADALIYTIKSSSSWKIRLNGLPALMFFFYKNLISFTSQSALKLMDVVVDCLSDENVEVREMAAKMLSGLLRCSQRQSILPLRNRFVAEVRRHKLPRRQDEGYADALRALHSAILGICALVESFPYSVEYWMPPLTEVLAPHASDPPPISTTIRKCASEFKKTHQDTWHEDQQAFDEDQAQALSSMLVGTSYYA